MQMYIIWAIVHSLLVPMGDYAASDAQEGVNKEEDAISNFFYAKYLEVYRDH
jgi:hypothetical protein